MGDVPRDLKTPALVVLHICLANSKRDEQSPEYRYGKRHKAMTDFLKEMSSSENPSIISIKELRACKDSEGVHIMSPAEICRDFCAATGYLLAALVPMHSAPGTDVPDHSGFHLAQLYDPTQFANVGSTAIKIIDDQSPTSMYYLQCRYAPLKHGIPNMARASYVETHHFPV